MSETQATNKTQLRVLLCAPRGFCAGVVRAIDIVERALEIYGAPVYVRHEIVHNKFVVDSLKAKGVVFVKELSEAPAGAHPVIFSAHGVAKAVPEEAKARNLFTIDATCPLVTKVHREAQAHFKRGRRIILIGHVGHPEVIGTMGQLPPGAVTLVASTEDVDRLAAADGRPVAYVTQTTLSVDDTRNIVAALKHRYPEIHASPMEDICYATTNRQEAVKTAARQVEAVIVVGAANSSNSQRLREVAEREGCVAQLVADEHGIDWKALENVGSVAVTAGASAPEALVKQILASLDARYEVVLEMLTTASEFDGLSAAARPARRGSELRLTPGAGSSSPRTAAAGARATANGRAGVREDV